MITQNDFTREELIAWGCDDESIDIIMNNEIIICDEKMIDEIHNSIKYQNNFSKKALIYAGYNDSEIEDILNNVKHISDDERKRIEVLDEKINKNIKPTHSFEEEIKYLMEEYKENTKDLPYKYVVNKVV